MYNKNTNSLIKHLDFIILDLIMLVFPFWISYVIRHDSFNILSGELYREYLIIILLLEIVVSVMLRNYKNILYRGYLQELKKVISLVSFLFFGLLIVSFFQKETGSLSRTTFILFYFISIAFIYGSRIIWKKHVIKKLSNSSKREVLLVADIDSAKDFMDKYDERGISDFSIRGIAIAKKDSNDNIDKMKYRDTEINGVSVVAINSEEIYDYIEENVVDEIIFAGLSNNINARKIIETCEMIGITVHLVLDTVDSLMGDTVVEKMAGINVISSTIKLVSSSDVLLKRLVDIFGSIVGLIITAVAFIFVAPAIFISDPGPVFFFQERVGRNGRRFKIYKFRSMYMDAEKRKAELMDKNEMKGLMFKMENDPRIIGSGEDGTKKGIGDDYIIGTTATTSHKYLISYAMVRGVVLQFLNFKASVCCIFERKVFGFIHIIIEKLNNIKSYNDQICNSVPILI